MSSSNAVSNAEATLDDVWRILKWHSKGKSRIETINRLWHKNQNMWGRANPRSFEEAELRVHRERWGPPDLWKLLHSSQVTDEEPDLLVAEVIGIRPEDKTYILDGRRRINHWKREGSTALVDMLIIVPRK